MDSFDPALVDALRRDGYSYTEIGQRLGKTKDATRGAHVRWLAGRAAAAQPDADTAVPDAGAGDAGPDGGRRPTVPAEGLAGPNLSAIYDAADRLSQAYYAQPTPKGRAAASASPVKSEIDIARANIAKVTRAEIRLKHSILAEGEINQVLAERLRAFDRALQDGVIQSLAMTVTDATD